GEHPDAHLALPDGDRAFAQAPAAARPGSPHRSAATSTAIVRLPARPALVPSPSISPRRRRIGKSLKGYSSAAIGFPSLCAQGLREAEKILWDHANEASARGVDIRDEEERDGDDERENQEQPVFRSGVSRTKANHCIPADR